MTVQPILLHFLIKYTETENKKKEMSYMLKIIKDSTRLRY